MVNWKRNQERILKEPQHEKEEKGKHCYLDFFSTLK